MVILTGRRILYLMATCLLLLQCKIDYENIVVLDDIPKGIPTIEMENARYTGVENFKMVSYLEVARMVIYQDPETVVIEDGRFLSFPDGEALDASGVVSSASYDRSTDNVDIDGNVFIKSEKDGVSINTRAIRWLDEQRTLEGQDDAEITITRDNGSWIRGRGFRINMADKTVSYKSEVRGLLIIE